MKKAFKIFAVSFFSFLLAVFASKTILYIWEIVIRINYNVFSPIVFSLSLFLLIIGKLSKEKANLVCVSLLIPLSFLNLVLCLFDSGFSLWTLLSFVSMIICILLGIYQGKEIMTKITSIFLGIVICVVILTPLGVMLTFASLMADIGEITVVEKIPSDDGRYIAVVKSSDEGALGGNTFVEVKDESVCINFIAFEVEKKAVRVYSGEYGEWKKIEICWKNNVLFIDGKEFVFD